MTKSTSENSFSDPIDHNLSSRLDHHRKVAGSLLADMVKTLGIENVQVVNDSLPNLLHLLPMASRASLCILAAEEYASSIGFNVFTLEQCIIDYFISTMPNLVPDDVRLLVSFENFLEDESHTRPRLFELILGAAESLVQQNYLGSDLLASELADHLSGWNPVESPQVKYIPKVVILRDRALHLARRPPAPPKKVGSIWRADAFGVAAISLLGQEFGSWPDGAPLFLEHCSKVTSARPSSSWIKVTNDMLNAQEHKINLVRTLLQLLVDTKPLKFMTDFGPHDLLLDLTNADLVRGLVWSTLSINEDWVIPTLQHVAIRCLAGSLGRTLRRTPVTGEKVPNACFQVLVSNRNQGGWRIFVNNFLHYSEQNYIEKDSSGLESMSAAQGMTIDNLIEKSIPDLGLDEKGIARVITDTGVAELSLDDKHTVKMKWQPGAGIGEQPPELKVLVEDFRKAAASERNRLESLLVSLRKWSIYDFHQRYVMGPLTSWFSIRLLWEVNALNGDSFVGLPSRDGAGIFVTPNGIREVQDGFVRIWHPVESDISEVRELRQMMASLNARQPIRQVWREVFLPDKVEIDTELYSNRFAGHIINFRQFYALARMRKWSGGFLSGSWDGGQVSTTIKVFPEFGVQAEWSLAVLDVDDKNLIQDLCTTSRVVFMPIDDHSRSPLPISGIPKVVFSETFRDLSLFVTICNVATDPIWLERFANVSQLSQYWETISHGRLDEVVTQRSELISFLITRGEFDDRIKLTGRHVMASGSFGTYFIDLLTANVRMDPPGKWISLNTTGLKKKQDLWESNWLATPIDDDEILIKSCFDLTCLLTIIR